MRDQAKMILASHRVQILPEKIFQVLWCISDSLSHLGGIKIAFNNYL